MEYEVKEKEKDLKLGVQEKGKIWVLLVTLRGMWLESPTYNVYMDLQIGKEAVWI